MAKGIFITATGTDVGKTYVTGLIVKKLRDAGYNAGYYKAALSGAEYEDGLLIPGDARHVKIVSKMTDTYENMVSYIYENAVSPHLASQLEGNPVELSVVKKGYEMMAAKYEYLTMEGSGGIVCPIRHDGQRILLEDIINMLGLKSIIIADAGLGTINSVVLTVEYMKHRQMGVKGIIFNHYHAENGMEKDNLKMVEELTEIPVVACVKDFDAELDMDVNKLTELYG